MVQLLWRRETEGRVFDSPERRAALDASLRRSLALIADRSLREHYVAEIRHLRAELFQSARRPAFRGPRGGGGGGGGRGPRIAAPAAPAPATRESLLARPAAEAGAERLREAVILAVLLTHPVLVRRFEGALERLECRAPDLDALLGCILRHAPGAADAAALAAAVAAEMGQAPLEKLFALGHVQIAPAIRRPDDPDLAAMTLAEELAKLEARRGALREIDEAMEDLSGLPDEGLTWRLGQAAEARNRAEKSQLDDSAVLGEDRAALSKTLADYISGEVWVKKNR
jgi:DNA primase